MVAIVDPVEKSRQQACQTLSIDRAYDNLSQGLDDPDVAAIVVATPTKYHCQIVEAAAQAGKHVLCEKPMAITADECDQMISAAELAGVKLQIGFMRRFDASFVAARERIEAGDIGQVVLVKSHTYGPTEPKPWMYDIRQSNGPLAEVNSHDIDTLRWFTQSEFDEVYAIGGNFRSPGARDSNPDFYDNVTLAARFKNGMQGSITVRKESNSDTMPGVRSWAKKD